MRQPLQRSQPPLEADGSIRTEFVKAPVSPFGLSSIDYPCCFCYFSDLGLGATMRARFKQYLVTGLLVLIPGVVSFWVLARVVQWVARALKFGILPAELPDGFADLSPFVIKLLNRALQFGDFGLSLLIVLIMILVVGALAPKHLGRRLIRWGEDRIKTVPLLGAIYKAVQQLVQAVFFQKGQFNRVVLIEFPRPGIWSVGLVSRNSPEVFNRTTGQQMLNVFVATTPNPTSGYLVMVPKEQCREVALKIEDAFNMIVSGGLVNPEEKVERRSDGLSSGN
jgi:uncharacterized membrane protein